MKIEFIDGRHSLYQAVKKLGRKYAATLGFMPDGGFEDYAARRTIITASEDGVLQGYPYESFLNIQSGTLNRMCRFLFLQKLSNS